jgi:hypothetical protein
MPRITQRSFAPVEGAEYIIETQTAAVRVRAGAGPGVRLIYDDNSPENFEGERSVELTDGVLELRKFTRAYVRYPLGPVPDTALQLDLFDCIDLAFVPDLNLPPRSAHRYLKFLKDATLIDDPDTGVTIEYDLVPSTAVALSEREASAAHLFTRAASYIGGAIRATEQFIVRLYHVVTFADGTTSEINVGLWTSAATTAGYHAVSLEHGMTRVWTAGVSSGLTPVPRPGWRLTIKRNAANGDLTNVSGDVYTRSLL